jgi:hypothetical protein
MTEVIFALNQLGMLANKVNETRLGRSEQVIPIKISKVRIFPEILRSAYFDDFLLLFAYIKILFVMLAFYRFWEIVRKTFANGCTLPSVHIPPPPPLRQSTSKIPQLRRNL